MLYLKKAELAKTYHISEKTVTNWIREAKIGKLDLELQEDNGKARIANTTRNIVLIEQLVEKRKKYRNGRGVKAITPKPQFYSFFTQQQIFDITSHLDIRREIPFKYGYFDGGADYWDKYANRLLSEKVSNILTTTIKQLRISQGYIDYLTAPYRYVNVIDIGPGNATPTKSLVEHLLEQNKLGRYVAVDISPSMLDIARRNIQEWFGTKVAFEACKADINYDRFTELLMGDAIGVHAEDTINIVLALGGTFSNLRFPDEAFKIVHDSINRNDLFVYNLKLDSEAARHYFDFSIGNKMPMLDAKAKMMMDLLNIDESLYEVEVGYDPELRQRYIRIRLKVELTITFAFERGQRSVELHKDDTILLWRTWHQNVQDVIQQLYRNDFDVLQSSLTEDKNYLLTISRVKSE